MDVYTTLADPIKYDRFRNPIEFKIRRDSISSVFVASDDELIFTKVISSVERRGDRVLIVGHDSWIDKPSMDLDKFERLQITMAAPAYVDVQQPDFAKFRKRYAAQTGAVPNSITRIGFECMMFLGQSLKQWGSGFVNELKQAGPLAGAMGRQYELSETRCNKIVPFVLFEDGVLRSLPQ
jgi:hypothetical protein